MSGAEVGLQMRQASSEMRLLSPPFRSVVTAKAILQRGQVMSLWDVLS